MHDAFLAAIADRPDDDLPRLVYADFLEEHGEPERAEFVRTQVELAGRPAGDPRRPALEAREAELLRGRKDDWGLAEFRGQSQIFRRGFVERVNVSAEWLLAHPAALAAPGPLRFLRVFNASGFVDPLAALPGLARLEALDLTNTYFPGGDEQVERFFTTAPLDMLRALVLRNSNFWEGEELAALAGTPVAPRLRGLDVSGNRIGDAGVRVIAERREFGRLEALTYRADELDYQFCVHGVGATALASSTTLTRLRVLDLSDHYVGDAGLSVLVNGPNAPVLERLAVDYNEIGQVADVGIETLVGSQRLTNLRELSLCGNRLGRLGAEALAAWPHLEQMRAVDLRECDLAHDAAATLRKSPWADRFVL